MTGLAKIEVQPELTTVQQPRGQLADVTPGDDDNAYLAEHTPSPVGVGDVIRGRFVLEAEVGSGGMGRVFRALDLRRQEARTGILTWPSRCLTHAFRQHPASLVALQREARRAQTLAHPNIISVFDFDREGSLVYLVMEYLRGRTLNDILVAARLFRFGR